MLTTPCFSFAGPSDAAPSRLPLTTCTSGEDGPPLALPIDVTASQQDRMRVSSQPYPSKNGPTDSSTSSSSVSASMPARYSIISPSIPSTTPSSPPSLRRTEASASRRSSSDGVGMMDFSVDSLVEESSTRHHCRLNPCGLCGRGPVPIL